MLCQGPGCPASTLEDTRLPGAGREGAGRNKAAQDMCDNLPQTGGKSTRRLVRPVQERQDPGRGGEKGRRGASDLTGKN